MRQGEATTPALAAGAAPGAVRAWCARPPCIDPDRILRLHRYGDPARVRPAIREAAERIAAQVPELVAPQALHRRVGVAHCRDGELRLEGGATFHCLAFERLLGRCGEAVAFILTLGPRLDTVVGDLMEAFEPLDALFLEAAGWLAIEAATRDLTTHLRTELAREGRALAHRMGPGYSYRRDVRDGDDRVGWPLEEQAELFRLFEGAELPVELLASCAMRPKMSRSGLFGVIVE